MQPPDTPRLPYRQWFPWLALFRAGGLAVGWPQLAISFVAVIAFWLGISLIGWWYPRETPALPSTSLIDIQYVAAIDHLRPLDISPSSFLNPSEMNPSKLLAAPWTTVVSPLSDLVWDRDRFTLGTFASGRNSFGIGLNLAWAVVVWSLFGTAICRAAAVQIAKDRSESFPQAVRYASARFHSTIGAPSIPTAAILATVIFLAVAAWFGRFPVLGGPLLTALSPLLFFAGVVIAFLMLVIVCGWPLMIAAMSVEDCDGFGALSRAYSFLAGRPVQAVWQAMVSAVYGSALVALVSLVFTAALFAEFWPLAENVGDSDKWGTVIQVSHVTAQLLLASFACSLFWSLATLNYLLLRQAVDQKPFEEIAAGVDEEFRSELPVVGIPASDYRPEHHDGRPTIDAESVVPAT